MNCREAQRQIFAAPDGALDEIQRAALATHVAGCTECKRIQLELAATVDEWRQTIQQLPVPDAERAWHDVRRAIRQPTPVPRQYAKIGWVGVPLAAAAAIALGLYWSPGVGPAAPASETVRVASRETSTAAASTVVYVDDKSGWTFVLADDTTEHRI